MQWYLDVSRPNQSMNASLANNVQFRCQSQKRSCFFHTNSSTIESFLRNILPLSPDLIFLRQDPSPLLQHLLSRAGPPLPSSLGSSTSTQGCSRSYACPGHHLPGSPSSFAELPPPIHKLPYCGLAACTSMRDCPCS
jgi:hypothetical protein